jgi:FAD/FMN-containing dehydrogenase
LLAQNTTQRELFWRIRETIPEAQTRSGGSIKHDVSVTISDLPRFIEAGIARCQQIAPEGVMVVYGHLGDGSLHFNINLPPQATDSHSRHAFFAKTPALNHAMHELIASYRGSISAEHGIGQLKRDELTRYKDPVALEVMRTIKRSLDPHGIMNPGKVITW